jgi:hypothetical protein
VRWGERVTPLARSDATLPPAQSSALDMVNALRAKHSAQREASAPGLAAPRFAETK